MLIIFAKILSVFGISFIGYGANKIDWLPSETTKNLSKILIYISSPCLVVYSMSQQELTADTLASVLQAAGLMFLALMTSILFSVFLVKIMRIPRADRGIYRMMMVFTNNGFMGYPLSLAVFGEDGLFLMIVVNAVFTLVLYSAGILLLIYDKDERPNFKAAAKSLLSIPFVTSVIGLVIFFLGWHLPYLIANFLDTIGGMTIPLSMLIIGAQLAESKIGEVLKNKHLYMVTLLRLMILPAVLFAIFVWIPVSPLAFYIVIFGMSMPCAAVIPVLAEIYQCNSKVAAQGVFFSTLFSMVSIPFCAILLTLHLGV